MPDVSDALHKLLNDLVKQVPRMALHDSNAFRRNLMYTEGVDAILRKHEGMLHGLFDIFALEPVTEAADLRARPPPGCAL